MLTTSLLLDVKGKAEHL